MKKLLTPILFCLFLYNAILAQVVSVSPSQNALNVLPNATIQVTFSTAMDTTTFNDTASFLVYGSVSGRHRGSFVFGEGSTVATFIPNTAFKYGEQIKLNLTKTIRSQTNIPITSFQTQFDVKTKQTKMHFSKAQELHCNNRPLKIVASDFNNDSHIDYVYTMESDSTGILLNDGSGTFLSKIFLNGDFNFTDSIASVDFNNDGNIDLAISDRSSIKIFSNDGNANFQLITTLGLAYPVFMTTGDWDGDGKTDIAVASFMNYIQILNNVGNFNFTEIQTISIAGISSLVSGDVDNDGDLDIIKGGNEIVVLLNNGSGYYNISSTLPASSSMLTIEDFDADGSLDIVADKTFLKNNGEGLFSLQNNSSVDGWQSISGDYNGDANIDLAVFDGNIELVGNNGSGFFSLNSSSPLGANYRSGLDKSDIDDDGDLDIVATNNIQKSIVIFKNISKDVSLSNIIPIDSAIIANSIVSLGLTIKSEYPVMKDVFVSVEVDTMNGSFNNLLFYDTLTVFSLDSNETRNIQFRNWSSALNGQYRIRMISNLVDDEIPFNDTLVSNVKVLAPRHQVIVIYDDEAKGGSVVKTALTNKGYEYDTFQKNGYLRFPLRLWHTIVWVSGQDSGKGDADSLISFLDRGGNLLIIDNQLITSQRSDDPSTSRAILVRQKLGIQWVSNFTSSTTVNGVVGDSIGKNISLSFSLGSGNKEKSTKLGKFSLLDSIMTYNVGGNAGWKRDNGNYKVVYAGFPIQNASPDSMRSKFVDQAMRWLSTDNYVTPKIVSITPTQNALAISPGTTIQVVFNREIKVSSVNDTASFIVSGMVTGRHRGIFNFNQGNTFVTFTPTVPFESGEIVSIVITDKIKDSNNVSIAPFVSQFTISTLPSLGIFGSRVNYQTGTMPYHIIVADLDNDGDGDVVTANESNTISVLKNNGDGTFASRVDYGAGVKPHSIVGTDLDRDGDIDLVVANSNSNYLSIFINMGDGTFTHKQEYSIGGNYVFAADLDGDGDNDLLVTGEASPKIAILKNNGDGTFAPKIDYATDSGPYSVFVSDIDNDGDADILVANSGSNTISVMMNYGDGTFVTKVDYPTGNAPFSIFASDIDNDGFSDVITENEQSNTISVFKNNGDGTFKFKVDYSVGSNPFSVFISDIDGDGDGDVVVANVTSNNISLLKNNGEGSFAPKVDYGTENYPYSVFVSDIDGDGDGDLVVANVTSNTISVLKNILGREIHGATFNDLNNNGSRDGGEPGLPNWQIQLIKNSIQIDSTLTDSVGNFTFIGINVDTLTIKEKLVSGWIPSYPIHGEYRDIVIDTAYINGIDFGNYQAIQVANVISGMKYYDLNRNGTKDGGENGIQNWLIRLIKNDLQIDSTLTLSDGSYLFSQVESGTYSVREKNDPGWVQSFPPEGEYTNIVIDSGTIVTGKDFGNYEINPMYSTLAGMKFNDLNGNGIHESGESGIENWIIYLSGASIDSVLTDANGNYEFSSLGLGTYTISEQQKDKWLQTYPSGSGTYSVNITLPGQSFSGLDFGNQKVAPKVKLILTVENSTGLITRNLNWGVRSGATRGIWEVDPQATSIDSVEDEYEVPPPLSQAFDARFLDPLGGEQHFGTGSWTDIRNYEEFAQVDTFKVGLHPGSAGYPIRIRWSNTHVSNSYSGTVRIQDAFGAITDMKSTDSLIISNNQITSVLIITSKPVLPYLYGKGWNLVSVSSQVTDRRKTTLFPNAGSHAFAFQASGGYEVKDTLNNGVGYWLKFPSIVQELSIAGVSRTNGSVAVSSDWNLIGSLSVPIATNTITSNPSGIITSDFFAYNRGYAVADTLEPYKGYWVKTSGNGSLIMNATETFGKQTTRDLALQNAGKLSIEDADGNKQELYFGLLNGSTKLNQSYELPPVPPSGIFDARFASNRMVEFTEEGRTKNVPINISSARYPVNISWEIKSSVSSGSLLVDGREIQMQGQGNIQVDNPESQIKLKYGSIMSEAKPKEFALYQNFPNPFNPATTIRYAIPEQSVLVTLRIYNSLGQEVATLVNEVQDTGYKTVQFNASSLPSGVYIYKLQAGEYMDVKKLLLMK